MVQGDIAKCQNVRGEVGNLPLLRRLWGGGFKFVNHSQLAVCPEWADAGTRFANKEGSSIFTTHSYSP
jgi:hypothetical protein